MAWEITAYAMTVSVLALAAAGVAGLVQLFRLLKSLEQSAIRLNQEAEATLKQLHALTNVANELAKSSQRSVQSVEVFTSGARALGDAAQVIAESASSVSSFWKARLTFQQTATAMDQEQMSGWSMISKLIAKHFDSQEK
ncbi:MAG: hypothetical protein P0Y55_11350 [Candidatus Cohnella colombiensis]|uniref:DUF948 domain-containing protein n=1 Tax=Candidatus Cohnella colombiensis TaxID=3121368 RepID=A0AA95EWF5_9BACL|nr:MAG: hypothetical protein P0Y55_11350 [Cohnella sp.]